MVIERIEARESGIGKIEPVTEINEIEERSVKALTETQDEAVAVPASEVNGHLCPLCKKNPREVRACCEPCWVRDRNRSKRPLPPAAVKVEENALAAGVGAAASHRIARCISDAGHLLRNAGRDLEDAGIFVEGFNLDSEEDEVTPERAQRANSRRNDGEVLVAGMTMNHEIVRRRLSAALSNTGAVAGRLDALIEDATDPEQAIGRALGAAYIKVLIELSAKLDETKADLKAISREFVVDPSLGIG